jgi:hypothetical protein
MAKRLGLALAAALLRGAQADAVPTGLLADFQKAPALGVRAAPRFTWIVPPCASAPDQAQVAYALSLYAADGTLVWASGTVASADSTYVLYGGPPLNASTYYTWTVATATQSCALGAPSAPAALVTALPDAGFDASARFLTTNATGATFGYFRAEVALPAGDAVVRAIAHVAAENEDRLLCGYKLYVNGGLAGVGPGRGEAPVWGGDGTFHGLPIQTLDVTAALLGGGGASAVLALAAMHRPPNVIMQLVLHLASGATRTVVTDGSWAAFDADGHRGPTPGSGSAGVGFIEHIDARQEPVGWRSSGFVPDARWAPALAAPPTAAQAADLHAVMKPPIQVTEGVAVASVYPVPPPPSPPPSSPATCGIAPENAVLLLGGCPGGAAISGIAFASWGTPRGYCPGHLVRNASCDSPTALAVVTAACVGKASCQVRADRDALGDPCYDVVKTLAVEVQCPGGPSPPPPPSNSTPASFVAVFPKEFQGGLVLSVENGTAGATVDIACGESLKEGGTVVGDDWGWHFTWTLRDGAQVLEQHKCERAWRARQRCRAAAPRSVRLPPLSSLPSSPLPRRHGVPLCGPHLLRARAVHAELLGGAPRVGGGGQQLCQQQRHAGRSVRPVPLHGALCEPGHVH